MVFFEELHAGACRRVQERSFHLHAGEVGRVHHAPLRMSTLAGKVVAEGRRVPGELRAHLDQLAHPRRPFGDRHPDRFLPAQICSGAQRVLDVLLEAVLGPEDGGDAALGIRGVGLGPAALREQGDGPVPGRLQREGKPSNSGPEHEVVELMPHVG